MNLWLLSSCAVPPREDRLQGVLDGLRDDYGLPGITAAFVLADGRIFTAASGYADAETGHAMTPASRMLAASIGKTLVAATALSLWDEGKLELDAPVATYLGHNPWFSRLANYDTVTLRQLLGHRSGLADHVYTEDFATELSQRWQEPGALFTPEQLLGFILDLPAQSRPDTEFAYSDSGYILTGMLLEAVSGRDYYELAREKFFDPLALTATSPSDRRSLSGLAAGYTFADNPFGFPAKSLTTSGDLAWHPGLEWTGGGLVSTSYDLARWGHALFNGEVLSSQALDAMLQTRVIDPADPKSRYGLGVALYRSETQGDVLGHAGWIPGYVSSLRHYQRYRITVAFQINTDIGLSGNDSHRLAAVESALLEVARTFD